MGIRTVEGATTLALLRRWLTYVHRRDRRLHASLLLDPWGKLSSWLFGRRLLERRLEQTEREIAKRYQGIILQVLRRAGVASQELEGQFHRAWQEVRRSLHGLADPLRVPQCLWAACSSSADPVVMALKPKLMLRALVDEVKPREESRVLRSLAYGEGPDDFPRDPETERLVLQSLASLHDVVLRNTHRLEDLTGGVLSASHVQSFRRPFTEYRDWLFRS